MPHAVIIALTLRYIAVLVDGEGPHCGFSHGDVGSEMVVVGVILPVLANVRLDAFVSLDKSALRLPDPLHVDHRRPSAAANPTIAPPPSTRTLQASLARRACACLKQATTRLPRGCQFTISPSSLHTQLAAARRGRRKRRPWAGQLTFPAPEARPRVRPPGRLPLPLPPLVEILISCSRHHGFLHTH